MTYILELKWQEIVRAAEQRGRNLMIALRDANHVNDEWLSFKDGRGDAVLATYFDTGNGGRPGTVASDVADLKQVFESFKDVYDFCNNVASPVQGDRFADWRKFT